MGVEHALKQASALGLSVFFLAFECVSHGKDEWRLGTRALLLNKVGSRS